MIYKILVGLAESGDIILEKKGKKGSPNVWKKTEVEEVKDVKEVKEEKEAEKVEKIEEVKEEPVAGGELQEVSNSPFIICFSSLPSAGSFCNETQEQPLRCVSLRPPLLYR